MKFSRAERVSVHWAKDKKIAGIMLTYRDDLNRRVTDVVATSRWPWMANLIATLLAENLKCQKRLAGEP